MRFLTRRGVVSRIAPMKALITGANGIVGSATLSGLSDRGIECIGLVRKTSDLSNLEGLNPELRYGSLWEEDSLAQAMEGCEAVVHCAARVSDWGSAEEFHRDNVEGVRTVLKAAQRSKVRKVVHISTLNAAGYGIRNMTENMYQELRWKYSSSKREGERVALAEGKERGIEVVVLRIGAVYGPGDWKFSFNIAKFIMRGRWFVLSRGRAVFTPSYIGNIIAAVYLALQKPSGGKIYNITDDASVSWMEFSRMFATALDVPLKVRSIPASLALTAAYVSEGFAKLLRRKTAPLLTTYRVTRASRDFHYSCERAKRELGYRPDPDIEDHLRATVRWCCEKLDCSRGREA